MTVLALQELTSSERSQFEQRDRVSALDQARAAGRMGASRIPDEALFPGGLSPSDTGLLRALDAFIAGQQERGK